jgi:hypothetical protein
MKLYIQNALSVLFEKTSSLRNAPDSWRCIHLKIPQMQTRYNRSLRTNFIINGLTTILGDDEGYVYVCRDDDIFILFQGRAKPILTKLALYFGDIDLRTPVRRANQPFELYDLSKDWDEFYELCFNKTLAEAYGRLLAVRNPSTLRLLETEMAP